MVRVKAVPEHEGSSSGASRTGSRRRFGEGVKLLTEIY